MPGPSVIGRSPRDQGELVINPIVYAEVSMGFDRIEDLEDAITAADFRREELPYESGSFC